MEDPDRFGAQMDPKTALQEIAAARGLGDIVYRVSATGPDHARLFSATAAVGDDVIGMGEGSSKKAAESVAAVEAVAALRARDA